MGAWIETRGIRRLGVVPIVAPYVGAWIETGFIKSKNYLPYVAPYVGAWIETDLAVCLFCECQVAPYVGAWIETYYGVDARRYRPSHPTWVRGLKQGMSDAVQKFMCRTLRGCVD